MAHIFVAYNIISTGNFFLVAREKDAPLAEVFRSDLLEPPHSQRNQTIDNLNPVMHSVELWDTLDNINLNVLRGRCDIDASKNESAVFKHVQFIPGMGRGTPYYDPADGTNEYINPDVIFALDGSNYLLFKGGFGALDFGTHLQTRPTQDGFILTDLAFAGGEEYTLFLSQVVTNTALTTGKSYPGDVIEEQTDFDFGTEHYNNEVEVNSQGGKILTCTILDLDVIPEGTLFGFNTHNGLQNYLTLQLPVGKWCMVNGFQENKIYIAKGESAYFIKKGNRLVIVNWDGDYRRVGERVSNDGLPPINALPEVGEWHLKADYPRVVDWYIARLPGGQVTAYADDTAFSLPNPDRYKWSVGATKFYVPTSEGLSFRATSSNAAIDTDGPREANSFQEDDNKDHNHVGNAYNRASARASDIDGQATPGSIDNTNGTIEYRVGQMDTTKWENARIKNQGTQARPKNIATNYYRIV